MDVNSDILSVLKNLKLLNKCNFVILYGSVAKGKANPLSDIDVCVSLSLPPKERMYARIKLLGELPSSYDLQIFEDLPIYIQKEVLGGKVLFVKERGQLINTALKVIYDYEDFMPAYNYYLNHGRVGAEI